MNAALVQRQAALAGVALLAALGAIAGRAGTAQTPSGLKAVPAADGGWYEALASSYGPGFYGRKTACGVPLTPETRGLAHPVLPCGAKLFVSYGGRTVFTEVVDRGPRVSGREFDLTEALANELSLQGIQLIRWRFAGEE